MLMKLNKTHLLIALSLSVLVMAGCGNMGEQPKLHKPYDTSPLFDTAARVPLEEAVPVGFSGEDEAYFNGTLDGEYITEFPESLEITRELIDEGRRKYEAYCSACHGYDGYGEGVVALEGYPQPASYHVDRLREAPVGYFYDVIRNGKGNMLGYGARVKIEDRWAVVAYIRALQYSQFAPIDEMSVEVQSEFRDME